MEVVNIYQITTDDGILEVKELANGMKIESLVEPSVEYLANQPPPPTTEPTELELLREDNANLWYENMSQSAKVEANEIEVSALWYEIMSLGGM